MVTPEVSGISGQIIFIEEAAEPSVHIEEGSEGLDEVELEFENPSLHCKSMRPPSGDLNLVLFQILPDLDEPAVPTTATKHQQTDAFFLYLLTERLRIDCQSKGLAGKWKAFQQARLTKLGFLVPGVVEPRTGLSWDSIVS